MPHYFEIAIGLPVNRDWIAGARHEAHQCERTRAQAHPIGPSLFAVENVRPKKSLAASPKIGPIFLHRK